MICELGVSRVKQPEYISPCFIAFDNILRVRIYLEVVYYDSGWIFEVENELYSVI